MKSAAKLLPFSDPTKFFAQKVLNFQKMYNPFDKILANSTLHLHFINSTYQFHLSIPHITSTHRFYLSFGWRLASVYINAGCHPASSPFPRPLPFPFPPHCVFLLLRRILSGLLHYVDGRGGFLFLKIA